MRIDTRTNGFPTQPDIHRRLAAASRRLTEAGDRGQLYSAGCEAALALLDEGPAAGAALLIVTTSGLTVIRAGGSLAGHGSFTVARATLPTVVVGALNAGRPVTVPGGRDSFRIPSPGPLADDELVVAPVRSRGRLHAVLAVAGSPVDGLRDALGVLADSLGLAVDAQRSSWAEAIIDGSQDIVLVLEPGGTIRSTNATVENILGIAPAMLVGTLVADLVHPADVESFQAWLGRAADGRGPAALDLRGRHVRGGWVALEATARAMLDVPDVRGLVVNLRDVRERETLQAELDHWALHDPLTNLANRAGLREQITRMLDRTVRSGARPAVLLVDLDDFKAVNDSLGHSEGDRLLVIVAERLRHCVGAGDVLARLGGDEFVVLLDDDAVAEPVADRILAALDSPVRLRDTDAQARASIGIRVADTPECEVDQLLRDADLAMYAAKASGKATWRRFHPEMYEQLQQQLTIRSELHRALDPNEFVLHYQPIVELDSLRIAGFEALIRWQHPLRGLLSPDTFIPEAELSGLIVPIGAWVIRRACEVAMTMRHKAGRELLMSVNVSPRQLYSNEIIEVVRSALDATGLPPSGLCLEITESVLADDAALVGRLRTLRALGVHLSIDDFGTGFSSYGHLQQLPVDGIKIDRSFVERLGPDEATPALARSIIKMSQALDLRSVAEGVETADQHTELIDLGCLFAQGYLFGRPLEELRALELLSVTEAVDTPDGLRPQVTDHSSDQ